MKKITTCALAVGVLLLMPAPRASAGTYYMYACPDYATAGPFTWWSNGTNFIRSGECGIRGPTDLGISRGRSAHLIANSPSPAISITGAYTPPYQVTVDCTLAQNGFSTQYFWSGGARSIDYLFGCNPTQEWGYGTGINQSFEPSSYFGWGATCSTSATCRSASSIGAILGVNGVRLALTENTGPGILPVGSNNLWFQNGHWVRGGGWPVSFGAGDPSGVCGTDLLTNGQFTAIDHTQDTSPNTTSFTQCPNPDSVAGTLNTSANGPLTIEYAASNAAGVPAGHSETVYVDNTPVSLGLSTPNDPDPNVWVDHSVQVIATPSSGPSGIAFTGCKTDNGAGYVYPAGGITLNGTGVWTVQCTSLNNAIAVDGSHASASQTMAIHIDETPPAVAFAPVDPADPQAVVANTTDGQSGVAGGQIMMRPASGGSWQSLASQFDGRHLLARFDDAALSPGKWVIQATSCDRAGNCASADETLSLPVRTASLSQAGFVGRNPSRTRCVAKRVKVGRHRSRRRRICKQELVLKSQDRVSFGRSAVLHGRLTSVQGAPIARALITILAAPQNGLYQYIPVASVRASPAGTWWVRLPPGPSRLIDAVYGGSPTVQPSQSWAHLLVPARVRVLRVWPRHVPWGGFVHIKARLLGGYLPPEGALVRLRLGYGNSKITYGVHEHVQGNGIFKVTNSFGLGPPSLRLRYWLQECTLPEGDYPFAPACGTRNFVTVGG